MHFKWVVCRVCLKNPGRDGLSSIFTAIGKDKYLFQQIMDCGGIKISEADNLPDRICENCSTNLNIAFKFRLQCQRSEKHLSRFVSKNDGDRVFEESNISETAEKILVKEEICSQNDENYSSHTEEDQEFVRFEISNTETEEVYSNDDTETLNADYDVDYLNEDYIEEEPLNSTEMQEIEKSVEDDAEQSKFQSKSLTESEPTKIESNVICYICGNMYPNKSKLNQHVRVHNEKPFECEICPKKFNQSVQLARHMNSHTGLRPYQCKHCPSKFADPSTCIKHERIHTKARPYECKTCGKSFSYSNVLKVHIMTHTGEKPFSCDVCGKKFSQLHHMKSHKKVHLESNPINVNKRDI